jgi:lipoprotein-anchoring transpeptidase ErfK/SrfK
MERMTNIAEPENRGRVGFAASFGCASRGQIMTQTRTRKRNTSARVTDALVFAGMLLAAPAAFPGDASAQALGYASTTQSSLLPGIMAPAPEVGLDEADGSVVPERLRRTIVSLNSNEAAGTIIIDTGNTALYFVLGPGRAIRYGVGVGRDGFTWSGVQTISRKAEWPDWHPPTQMIARQPYLPRFMAGGPGNPLGARAMYLGSSEYRIHGTNDPSTIGKFVSSGCIRLTNEDVTDLFNRVDVGTKVVVLPKNSVRLEASIAPPADAAVSRLPRVTTSTRAQQVKVSTSALY